MVASAHEGLIKSSLYLLHEQLGAKIVDFAGWAMPLEYDGTVKEHEAVRSDVGVFDVSHLGTLLITGDGAEATIAAAFTNNPSRLEDGESQYTLCCDENGGIVDDLIVYRLAADRYLCIPNAANTWTVRGVLGDAAEEHGAEVEDASTRYAILAVQGPRALDVLREMFAKIVDAVPYRGIGEIDLGPSDTGWLCRTGYTGEIGAELVLPALDAPGVFRRLIEQHDVRPVGLGARDTLRLEMGYPLHGNDLSTETDPFEAQLSWAVKLDSGAFRGRDALVERKERGPARKLRGLLATERAIPRPGMEVSRDGEVIGEVTSGTFSPTLRKGIGLAYLDAETGPGDAVTVDVRGKEADFEVVKPPFVDADPRGS